MDTERDQEARRSALRAWCKKRQADSSREAGQSIQLARAGQRQRAALQDLLHARDLGSVQVALGMRYGQPSIAMALRELREAGCNRLLVLPLRSELASALLLAARYALEGGV